MLEQERQQLEMLQTALSYLDANNEIWGAVPIISTYRSHLADSISGIECELENHPESPDFGGTTLQQLRITVAEKMDVLDDILEAYAEDIKDQKLLEEAENSKSDYLRLTNDGFERKVTLVQKLIRENLDELKKYGLLEDQMSEVEQDFEAYKEKRSSPPTKPSAETSTTEVHLLLTEGIESYTKLKTVMVSFRTSHHSFYQGFKSIEHVDTSN